MRSKLLNLRRIFLSQNARRITSASALTLLGLAFLLYLRNNPTIVVALRQTSLMSIGVVFFIYTIFVVANYLLVLVTARYFEIRPKNIELFMVTIYSTLVNFFGPLQSGPGYRAIHFKTRHGIKLKAYAKVTMLYYLIFMILSALMFFSPRLYFLPALAVAFLVICIVYKRGLFLGYDAKFISTITLIAAFQLLLGVFLFYSELSFVGDRPTIASAISYTGGANLAILAGITPGAIGIREGFLVLSQSLHGIPNEQLLAANVLDRSVYFLFLFVLFTLSNALQIKKKLAPR